MKRLIEYTVFSGLVMACRFATCPTSRSPLLVKATTEGVVRPPSSFGITLGSPPSITATTEFVVPKSIPIIFAIASLLLPAQSSCASLCFQASHLSLLLSSYLMLGLTSWIHSLAICRRKTPKEDLGRIGRIRRTLSPRRSSTSRKLGTL